MPNFIDNIINMRVMDLPVGQALLLTAAFGLSGGTTNVIGKVMGKVLPADMAGTVAKFIPLATNGLFALGINKIDQVKNMLGPDLTELLSIAALTNGINQTVDISGMVANGISRTVSTVFPALGTYPQHVRQYIAPPVPEPVQANALMTSLSGYNMGQAPAEAQNVDDIDLLLLSSRGYHTK